MKKVKLFCAKTGAHIATVEKDYTGVNGEGTVYFKRKGDVVAHYPPAHVIAIDESAIVDLDLLSKLSREAAEAAKNFVNSINDVLEDPEPDAPLDLTKILEVGDVVCTDEYGDVTITLVDTSEDSKRTPYVVRGSCKRFESLSFDRQGNHDSKKKPEQRLKPKDGKTWAQFAAEKRAKKDQKTEIRNLEKAVIHITKALKNFDDPEVEVRISMKKLIGGGYTPSKIHIANS